MKSSKPIVFSVACAGIALAMASFIVFAFAFVPATQKIGKLKYNGGGDWYANKTSLKNLIDFCNTNLKTNLEAREEIVDLGSSALYEYPFIHMTGHGNVVFSTLEANNLRNYLTSGGFLHADDNYGLDTYFRREIKKVFPDNPLVEVPFTHPIYSIKYPFAKGLPKVHEHDGKPPRGYGIFIQGRLVCFYTHECDLGNGWEDQAIYNDSEEVRTKALQMGANIVAYAFSNP